MALRRLFKSASFSIVSGDSSEPMAVAPILFVFRYTLLVWLSFLAIKTTPVDLRMETLLPLIDILAVFSSLSQETLFSVETVKSLVTLSALSPDDRITVVAANNISSLLFFNFRRGYIPVAYSHSFSPRILFSPSPVKSVVAIPLNLPL